MGIRNAVQYQIPEFESFERFLHEWLAKQEICSTDFVFSPQHVFTEDSIGNQIVDFVGRVETLSDDMMQVKLHVPSLGKLRRDNSTGGAIEYRDAYTNSDMIELVRDIYIKDVRKFDYDF